MDVSIVIVNYKTKELCRDCINSVIEKTLGIEYEIILVDNNSQDGSVEYLKNIFGDKILFIESPNNVGFGRANNLGIKRARGRVLFLLNSDTVVINNAIKILYEYLLNNESIGVVGANLYNRSGKPMHSYMLEMPSLKNDFIPCFLIRMLRRFNYAKSSREFNVTGKPLEVAYITGADMMIKREALEKAGYFDPEFFMYSEEVELTYRIKKSGYKVYSVPEAEIIHLEGASSGKRHGVNVFKETNWLNGKCLYYEKVYGKDSVLKYLTKLKLNRKKSLLHDIICLSGARFAEDKYMIKLTKEYIKKLGNGETPYKHQTV